MVSILACDRLAMPAVDKSLTTLVHACVAV